MRPEIVSDGGGIRMVGLVIQGAMADATTGNRLTCQTQSRSGHWSCQMFVLGPARASEQKKREKCGILPFHDERGQ